MAERPITRDISIELVRSLLRYEPETGRLVWLVSRGCVAAGMTAGCVKSDRGYVAVRINGDLYYGHRIAWALMTGADLPADTEIDHRDGVTSNNRWSNLRLATAQQNKRNMRTPDHNTSGVKGVTFRKNRNKWQAQMSIANECRYLGSFDTFEEAVAVREKAEREIFGAFSTLNRS